MDRLPARHRLVLLALLSHATVTVTATAGLLATDIDDAHDTLTQMTDHGWIIDEDDGQWTYTQAGWDMTNADIALGPAPTDPLEYYALYSITHVLMEAVRRSGGTFADWVAHNTNHER